MSERPDILLQLHELDAQQLREVIAVAAGAHAHMDRDGGLAIATVLRRIADRLTGAPRRTA